MGSLFQAFRSIAGKGAKNRATARRTYTASEKRQGESPFLRSLFFSPGGTHINNGTLSPAAFCGFLHSPEILRSFCTQVI